MKLVSWNVNGLRACIQKGFLEQFDKLDADFFCLQETKLSEGQLQLDLPGYEQYWCYADKKGYSGTAIFAKHTPLSVRYGLGVEDLDNEGRLITLEYPEFYLLTCYTPNAQRELARLDHRMKWDEAFRNYIRQLDMEKPVILCGDLNVAHQEIDLKNPKSNRGSAGFSDQERQSFQATLDAGFTDTFRYLHPDARDCYSWWSYMFKAREKNAGWRIDYFLVSDRVRQDVYRADIHSEILGSDHCPVSIHMDLVCNGSIWSPSSEGKASIAGNENTASEPKASAVSAKAIVPLVLAFVLLITLAAPPLLDMMQQRFMNSVLQPFPPNSAPSWPVVTKPMQYFTVTVCESFPATPAVNRRDSVTFRGIEYHLADTLPLAMYTNSNAWLQITLTDEGKRAYNEESQVQVTPTPRHSSVSLVNVSDLWIGAYYTDADRLDFGGWFIFADMLLNDTFTIDITEGDTFQTMNVDVSPRVDLTKLSQPFTYLLYNDVPRQYNDDLATAPEENWTDRVCISINNQYRYTHATHAPAAIADGRYWVYVEPSSEMQRLMALENITLDVDTPYDGFYYTANIGEYSLHIITIYEDSDLTKACGWLIYGNDPFIYELCINFHCDYMGIVTMLELDLAPHGENRWKMMSSAELIEAILGNNDTYPILITDPDNLSDIRSVRELLSRPGCIAALMNHPVNELRAVTPELLMNHPDFRALMTPEEEVLFLLGDYATSPENKIPRLKILDRMDADLSKVSTTYLVTQMLYNTIVHHHLLSQCSSEESRQLMYLRMRELIVYLPLLEERNDAMEVIERYLEAAPDGCILHWIVELWPYIQSLPEE